MNCSRCGCSPDCHEIDEVENERERGNDAVALENYDLAIIHYSRALELNNVDWRIWSNRSKCYSAKRWFSQAFSDAERACLLDNENYKVCIEIGDIYLYVMIVRTGTSIPHVYLLIIHEWVILAAFKFVQIFENGLVCAL